MKLFCSFCSKKLTRGANSCSYHVWRGCRTHLYDACVILLTVSLILKFFGHFKSSTRVKLPEKSFLALKWTKYDFFYLFYRVCPLVIFWSGCKSLESFFSKTAYTWIKPLIFPEKGDFQHQNDVCHSFFDQQNDMFLRRFHGQILMILNVSIFFIFTWGFQPSCW